jgi:hypothetical protein
MAAIESGTERFDMGRVVRRTFEVFGKNFVSFSILSVLIIVPQVVLQWWWIARVFLPGMSGTNFVLWPSLARLGVIFVASLVLGSVLQAALVYGTVATLNHRTANFAECLATGMRSLPKVIGIGFLQGILIVLGLVLVVVPGLIVIVILCVSVPVCVVENKPVLDSFSRSAELTSGHRWAIFGVIVAYLLTCFIIGFVFRPLVGFSLLPASHLPLPINSVFWVANSIIRIVTTSFAAVLVASIYYELRMIKEGVQPEQLAEVFA